MESTTETAPLESPTPDASTVTLALTELATPTPDTTTNTPSPTQADPSTLTATNSASSEVDPAETAIPDTADTATDAIATEVSTLTEVLQELPEDTEVVVLDTNGQSVSLVTQEAIDIIATSDPVWCPDGVAPTPAANGCTVSYATMNDLLTFGEAYINSQTTNGTIWITSGVVGDTGLIDINGATTYSNWAKYSLTLQGVERNFSDTTIGSNSVFCSDWISAWYSTVTINILRIPAG
jgi:hypothetical protein